MISCCHIFDNIDEIKNYDVNVRIKQNQIEDVTARLRLWQKSSTRGEWGSRQDIAILELIDESEVISNISWDIDDTINTYGTVISFGYHFSAQHGVKTADYTAWEVIPSGFLRAQTNYTKDIKRGYSGSPLIDLSNAYRLVGIIHGVDGTNEHALIISASEIITQIKILEGSL